MHHHCIQDKRPLMCAISLLLKPVLVYSVRSFTRDINVKYVKYAEYAEYVLIYLTPPARLLRSTTGPGGICASNCSNVLNMVAALQPKRQILWWKSNGGRCIAPGGNTCCFWREIWTFFAVFWSLSVLCRHVMMHILWHLLVVAELESWEIHILNMQNMLNM